LLCLNLLRCPTNLCMKRSICFIIIAISFCPHSSRDLQLRVWVLVASFLVEMMEWCLSWGEQTTAATKGWAKKLVFEYVWNQMQSVWVDLRHTSSGFSRQGFAEIINLQTSRSKRPSFVTNYLYCSFSSVQKTP
jgi:hypothetical protein